jgi:predicted negative regulator of RcsB-dependent stress response
MARKKRRFEAVEPVAPEPKNKGPYEDAYQHNFGHRVENATKFLEGQGKNILYGIAALVVLAIIGLIIYRWSASSNAAAQTALGKAIETSQAVVSASPLPAGSTEKSFKTEKERAEASITEFQAVADKFGGSVGEKAKFFVAVNRLSVDRPAGTQELEGLAKSSSEVGKMAKFALAGVKTDDGKQDEALTLYQELAGMTDPIVSKETINFEIAKIYEKQGKKQDAVDLLFNMVKTASEAKDLDGKPVPLSSTAQNAKEKLEQLDPAKAKEVPEQAPDLSSLGIQ